MRMRGASITDIIVLVVDCDDGVMAQTEESIQHAKASGCKLIVAVNKIDKYSPIVVESKIRNVKNSLLTKDIISEDFGGEVQVIAISALKKINLEGLKESIWTEAELLDLRGDPNGLAEGFIIESSTHSHLGKIATMIVVRGSVKRGDFIVSGSTYCKVKTLLDSNSKQVSKATLSQAVQVTGWKDLPLSGDEVLQFKTEKEAKSLVELRNKINELIKQKNDNEVNII
jgi:translation initiation factor IF-2